MAVNFYTMYDKDQKMIVFDYELENKYFIVHKNEFFWFNDKIYFPTETIGVDEDEGITFLKRNDIMIIGIDNESN